MKYFEIHEPYYSLIKGENEQEAIKTYVELVAYDDGSLKDEIKEINALDALIKFGTAAAKEPEKNTFAEIIESFTDIENKLLLIDGSLL